MTNWFKKVARGQGASESLMEKNDRGEKLPSVNHLEDPDSLVRPKPQFGGNRRPGDVSIRSHEDELSEEGKNRQFAPHENVLMDQDPPTGEGVNNQEFVAEVDKIPENRLDNVDIGPHNMQNSNVFNRIKQRTRTRWL